MRNFASLFFCVFVCVWAYLVSESTHLPMFLFWGKTRVTPQRLGGLGWALWKAMRLVRSDTSH